VATAVQSIGSTLVCGVKGESKGNGMDFFFHGG
jgi:hypothetical protein